MVLSVLVKYWCIFYCHKCKVKCIELEVMKVVLIRVIKEKKVINIVFKSEITQLFCDIFLLIMTRLLCNEGSINMEFCLPNPNGESHKSNDSNSDKLYLLHRS